MSSVGTNGQTDLVILYDFFHNTKIIVQYQTFLLKAKPMHFARLKWTN